MRGGPEGLLAHLSFVRILQRKAYFVRLAIALPPLLSMGCESSTPANEPIVADEESDLTAEAPESIKGMKGVKYEGTNGNRKGNDKFGNQGYTQAELDERHEAAVKIQSAARQKVVVVTHPPL